MARDNTLARLRARRAKIGAGADPLYLDVPGYGGDLVIKCKWVPYEELTARAEELLRIRKPTLQQLYAAADTLIRVVDDFLIVVDDDEGGADEKGRKPLAEDGTATQFDQGLAEALGFDFQDTARKNVFELLDGNGYAVINMAAAISVWLEDTSRDVNTEFSGN